MIRFLIITPTFAFDVCELRFGEGYRCIDETGYCGGSDPRIGIRCDEAYSLEAHRLGSVPLPSLPGGLLYQPLIAEYTPWWGGLEWSPYDYSHNVEVALGDLVDQISWINDELNFWAPRILYVPSRAGLVLRGAYESIQELERLVGEGETTTEYVSWYFDSNPAIKEFCVNIIDSADLALRSPDIRYSGLLNSLIPYLYLFSELDFAFPLIPDVLDWQLALVQTVSQYDPMFLSELPSPVWRFRIRSRPGWAEYRSERFLLNVAAPLEHRTTFGMECEDCDSAECFRAVGGALGRLDVTRPNASETLASLFHLIDRAHPYPECSRIVAFIQTSISGLCNTYSFDNFKFGQFTRVRTMLLMMHMVPKCFPMPKVVEFTFDTTPYRHPTIEDIDSDDYPTDLEAETLIEFVSSQRAYKLFFALYDFTRLHPEWMREFVERVIRPSLAAWADVPMITRRTIGRVIGFGLWAGDVHIVGLFMVGTTGEIFDRLFLGSYTVRMGVYDVLPFGSIEAQFGTYQISKILPMIWTRSFPPPVDSSDSVDT
jgi:hypothetical protein